MNRRWTFISCVVWIFRNSTSLSFYVEIIPENRLCKWKGTNIMHLVYGTVGFIWLGILPRNPNKFHRRWNRQQIVVVVVVVVKQGDENWQPIPLHINNEWRINVAFHEHSLSVQCKLCGSCDRHWLVMSLILLLSFQMSTLCSLVISHPQSCLIFYRTSTHQVGKQPLLNVAAPLCLCSLYPHRAPHTFGLDVAAFLRVQARQWRRRSAVRDGHSPWEPA